MRNKNELLSTKCIFSPKKGDFFLHQTAAGVLPATLKHFIISNWGLKHVGLKVMFRSVAAVFARNKEKKVQLTR